MLLPHINKLLKNSPCLHILKTTQLNVVRKLQYNIYNIKKNYNTSYTSFNC